MSTSGVMAMGSTATSLVDADFEEWLHARQPALMLGVSVGTVKSQCSRALTSLRDRAPSALQQPQHLEEDR